MWSAGKACIADELEKYDIFPIYEFFLTAERGGEGHIFDWLHLLTAPFGSLLPPKKLASSQIKQR